MIENRKRETLTKLFNGELNPAEMKFVNDNNFGFKYDKINELEITITNLLPEEKKSLASIFRDKIEEKDSVFQSISFSDGFSLGLKIAVECFLGDNE